MNKPTLKQFTAWAKANRALARNVIAAQAFAQCERERVNAYIAPVFAKFDFRADRHAKNPGEKITKPSDLYLSTDEAKCAEFYAACDTAHRAHGFTGPEGYCPALIAETARSDAENMLLDAGAALLGVDHIWNTLEQRKQALDLFLGACLKSDEKIAA
jgi:hypothetical protein